MAVRSKPLFTGKLLTTGYVALYQTPAGETTLIKNLVATNGNAGAQSFDLQLQLPGPINHQLAWKISVPAASTLILDIWWAMSELWWLTGRASVASAITLNAFGSELEGVAD